MKLLILIAIACCLASCAIDTDEEKENVDKKTRVEQKQQVIEEKQVVSFELTDLEITLKEDERSRIPIPNYSDQLIYTIINHPSYGKVTILKDKQVIDYQPIANFHGQDKVIVNVKTEDKSFFKNFTINYTVEGVNDAPIVKLYLREEDFVPSKIIDLTHGEKLEIGLSINDPDDSKFSVKYENPFSHLKNEVLDYSINKKKFLLKYSFDDDFIGEDKAIFQVCDESDCSGKIEILINIIGAEDSDNDNIPDTFEDNEFIADVAMISPTANTYHFDYLAKIKDTGAEFGIKQKGKFELSGVGAYARLKIIAQHYKIINKIKLNDSDYIRSGDFDYIRLTNFKEIDYYRFLKKYKEGADFSSYFLLSSNFSFLNIQNIDLITNISGKVYSFYNDQMTSVSEFTLKSVDNMPLKLENDGVDQISSTIPYIIRNDSIDKSTFVESLKNKGQFYLKINNFDQRTRFNSEIFSQKDLLKKLEKKNATLIISHPAKTERLFVKSGTKLVDVLKKVDSDFALNDDDSIKTLFGFAAKLKSLDINIHEVKKEDLNKGKWVLLNSTHSVRQDLEGDNVYVVAYIRLQEILTVNRVNYTSRWHKATSRSLSSYFRAKFLPGDLIKISLKTPFYKRKIIERLYAEPYFLPVDTFPRPFKCLYLFSKDEDIKTIKVDYNSFDILKKLTLVSTEEKVKFKDFKEDVYRIGGNDYLLYISKEKYLNEGLNFVFKFGHFQDDNPEKINIGFYAYSPSEKDKKIITHKWDMYKNSRYCREDEIPPEMKFLENTVVQGEEEKPVTLPIQYSIITNRKI